MSDCLPTTSDYFPQEVTVQILIRLPIPSLLKCTSVCKNWHALITSSHFIPTRLSHTLSNPSYPSDILIRNFTENPKKQHFSLNFQTLPTPFLPPPENLYNRVVGCVNGLVCISDDIFCYADEIIIWNPLIRRFIELPTPNVTYFEVGPYMPVLGFGFDSRSNDFKVVRLVYKRNHWPDATYKIPPTVEVCAVKKGGWRRVNGENVRSLIVERTWSQCFLNECVHWPAFEKILDGEKWVSIKNLILMFNTSDESFTTMELPNALAEIHPSTLFISETKRSLWMFEYDLACGEGGNDHGTMEYCSIWVQKEYGVKDSWSKIYKVEVDKGFELVRGVRDNGEILLAKNTYETEEEGELVSYDARSKIVRSLGLHGFADAFYVAAYTESLHLLDKDSNAVTYEVPAETETNIASASASASERNFNKNVSFNFLVQEFQ